MIIRTATFNISNNWKTAPKIHKSIKEFLSLKMFTDSYIKGILIRTIQQLKTTLITKILTKATMTARILTTLTTTLTLKTLKTTILSTKI